MLSAGGLGRSCLRSGCECRNDLCGFCLDVVYCLAVVSVSLCDGELDDEVGFTSLCCRGYPW
jgi:hypothetical protein